MEDRFKFRAWDKIENTYIYDAEQIYDTPGIRAISFGDMLDGGYSQDFIVEQCTGLKDKNGKLIYEGDILGGVLESTYVHWCRECKNFQLKNCIGECMGCGGDIYWYEVVEDDGKLEVIGNIHENPELLEE